MNTQRGCKQRSRRFSLATFNNGINYVKFVFVILIQHVSDLYERAHFVILRYSTQLCRNLSLLAAG